MEKTSRKNKRDFGLIFWFDGLEKKFAISGPQNWIDAEKEQKDFLEHDIFLHCFIEAIEDIEQIKQFHSLSGYTYDPELLNRARKELERKMKL